MLVGIDIGSHKICTMIGEALPGGRVRVLGMGHAPASGIRRGEVVHVEDAAGAIAASVQRAERTSGQDCSAALVGITGVHLSGMNSRAVVPIGRHPRAVEPGDVKRALEAAGTVPMGAEREALHVLPAGFCIDEGHQVVSPLGMTGYRLESHVHIVTASTTALANLRRCTELAEVAPMALVMSTLAAAEATLTQDERELGTFVVDLGAGTTVIACFSGGALVHTAVIPVGGLHLTRDLSTVLQVPLAQAERIKLAHGHVWPELDEGDANVDIMPFGEAETRRVPRQLVSEILADRADELARLVGAELARAGLAQALPAGAVFVGGGTELGGLPKRLCQAWDLPGRIGRPTDVVGLAEAARGPAHAGVVGLLAWQARDVQDAVGMTPLPTRAGEGGRASERFVAWLRQAFVPEKG